MIAELVIPAWLISTMVMLALWAVHLKTKNAGLVDIGWSANFGFIAIAFAILGEGFGLRHMLLTTMVLVWSFRLTSYLAIRTKGEAYRRYQRSTSAFFPWFPKQLR